MDFESSCLDVNYTSMVSNSVLVGFCSVSVDFISVLIGCNQFFLSIYNPVYNRFQVAFNKIPPAPPLIFRSHDIPPPNLQYVSEFIH